MKGCLGVLAGLIIGAALSFSLLVVAVAATGAEPDCLVEAPSGWLIRVLVPWDDVAREMASTKLPVAGGYLTVQEVGEGSCGRVQARAAWEGSGLRVGGVGLVLEAQEGAATLAPVRLLLGRMDISLAWVPDRWLERLAQPVAEAAGAALTRELQGEGMGLCGLVGEKDGLALYLCAEGD